MIRSRFKFRYKRDDDLVSLFHNTKKKKRRRLIAPAFFSVSQIRSKQGRKGSLRCALSNIDATRGHPGRNVHAVPLQRRGHRPFQVDRVPLSNTSKIRKS